MKEESRLGFIIGTSRLVAKDLNTAVKEEERFERMEKKALDAINTEESEDDKNYGPFFKCAMAMSIMYTRINPFDALPLHLVFFSACFSSDGGLVDGRL